MNISDIRMTLYALVSALERDLRDAFVKYALPNYSSLEFLRDESFRKRISERYLKDYPGLQPEYNRIDLVEYLDYGDIITLIIACKKNMNQNVIVDLKSRYASVEKSISVRNRVMHGRPLNAGDFSLVFGLVSDLLHIGKYEWVSCADIVKKLSEDPSFVLSLTLPISDPDEVEIFNNLPAPDFDDTGFIGRKEDLQAVKKLILGPNRVISLIGSGGVGKTALMLKVAYSILDMRELCPFDAIIWLSCKTNALTNSGIEKIKNAIDTYSGVIETIESEMGGCGEKYTEKIDEILTFVHNFNTLIIFDNLETVISNEIREFLRSVQETATIAITSRVGLGELEIRRQLLGMRHSEAERLLKEHALIRNVNMLKRAKTRQISNILEQLHYNPLGIKWFVQAVSTGRSPNEVLSQKDDMLEFCMANVYDTLNPEEVCMLNTILTARSSISEPEILFYTNMKQIELRLCMNKLLSTSLVEIESESGGNCIECKYSITPLAREYLFRHKRPDKEFTQEILKKRRELVGINENTNASTKADEFAITSLSMNSQAERIAGRLLRKALNESRRKDYDSAERYISEAKAIMPHYYEIYKVSGLINAQSGRYMEAEEEYRRALDLAPDNPRVQFFYGGYLLRYVEDSRNAIEYLGKAYKARSDSPTVVIEYARCLGYTGEHEEAIRILNNLLEQTKNISMKHNKLTTTLLMSFYKRMAESEYQVKKDAKSAIRALQLSIEIFENTSAYKDLRLIEALDDTMSEYRNIIRRLNDPEEYKRFQEIEKKHEGTIKYKDFSTEKRVNRDSTEIDEGLTQGLVYDLNEAEKYGFIQTESGARVYFNIGFIRNRRDWRKLELGCMVEFSIGRNHIGKCAVDVRIV